MLVELNPGQDAEMANEFRGDFRHPSILVGRPEPPSTDFSRPLG